MQMAKIIPFPPLKKSVPIKLAQPARVYKFPKFELTNKQAISLTERIILSAK